MNGGLIGLDLFSGIGGITLALQDWVHPCAYCEIEPFAQSLLLQKMASGELPFAPIWDDVKTLDGRMLPKIEIIYGGFPCQDISSAGLGAGLEGKRSGLFFEIIRLVKETKPVFVFLENVPAIRTRGLKEVIGSLTDLGYDCRWNCVSAAELGAPHVRKRWFLLAYAAKCPNKQKIPQSNIGAPAGGDEKSFNQMAYANGEGLPNGRPTGLEKKFNKKVFAESKRRCGARWAIEPNVGRMAYGIPFRVDRIRGLGNAVVPIQAKKAFEILMGLR